MKIFFSFDKMSDCFQDFPVGAISQSEEYERALCDLIIMMAPFAPMLASELWAGVQTVPHKCTHYKWVSSFWVQWNLAFKSTFNL